MQSKLIYDFIKNNSFILIVLDACRFDYFKQYNNIKGILKEVNSNENVTCQWLKTTWINYYPFAYVSASPLVRSYHNKLMLSERHRTVTNWIGGEHFEKVINVWDWGWDEDLQTVPAYQVVKATKDNYTCYSKMIVHFLQPHGPYVGKTQMSIAEAKIVIAEDSCKVRLAYADNLSYVIENGVKPLLTLDVANIAITADHGELLGEYGKYGHGDHFSGTELYHVPWLEVER